MKISQETINHSWIGVMIVRGWERQDLHTEKNVRRTKNEGETSITTDNKQKEVMVKEGGKVKENTSKPKEKKTKTDSDEGKKSGEIEIKIEGEETQKNTRKTSKKGIDKESIQYLMS